MRKTRREWVRLVEAWRVSGQTQVEFAAAHRVNVHTLRWWIYDLRTPASVAEPARGRFVELGAAGEDAPARGVGVRVELGHAVLEFSTLPPAAWLRELFSGAGV
jgi:hypothetical protein